MRDRAVHQRVARIVCCHVLICCVVFSWLPSIVAAQSDSDEAPAVSATCGYGPSQPIGSVRATGIREASALVASQRWPGVYWTLNDAHNTPTLFAIDEAGQNRGQFQVPGVTNIDWEALQLGPDGEGGYALYVGDIGDNKYQRRDGIIYRVPEPDLPPAGSPSIVGSTAQVTAFHFVFPTGANNAEALLVHPRTGEMLLISRGLTGLSAVYRVSPSSDDRDRPMLELIDAIDVRPLDPSSGQITDAAVSPDARHVVLRTYRSALVYDVAEGASLTSIWRQVPRVYHLDDGRKAEGITYSAAGDALISLGEGTSPTLYRTGWQC